MQTEEKRIRVPKELRFANSPLEHLKLHRKVFRNYLELIIGYTPQESYALLEIFDIYINEDNILHYVNRKAGEIYDAILKGDLESIKDYTQDSLIKNLKNY